LNCNCVGIAQVAMQCVLLFFLEEIIYNEHNFRFAPAPQGNQKHPYSGESEKMCLLSEWVSILFFLMNKMHL